MTEIKKKIDPILFKTNNTINHKLSTTKIK